MPTLRTQPEHVRLHHTSICAWLLPPLSSFALGICPFDFILAHLALACLPVRLSTIAVCLFASVAAAALFVVRSCPVPVGLLQLPFDPLCPVFALAVSCRNPCPVALPPLKSPLPFLLRCPPTLPFSLQFSPFWTLASGLSLGSPTGHFGLLGPLIALEGSQVASLEAILPLGRRRLALF